MTNFEAITGSPEHLGAFLHALPCLEGPWDDAFHRLFCSECNKANCDVGGCPHQAERDNPIWWLKLEVQDNGKQGI